MGDMGDAAVSRGQGRPRTSAVPRVKVSGRPGMVWVIWVIRVILAVWVVWAIWVKVSGRPGAFNVVCGVGVVRTHLLLAQAAGHVAALREVLDLAHG